MLKTLILIRGRQAKKVSDGKFLNSEDGSEETFDERINRLRKIKREQDAVKPKIVKNDSKKKNT